MVSATFSVPLHKLNSSFIDNIKAFIDKEGGEHDDFETQMSDEQSNALGEAIQMTYDNTNLIPQSEAKKLLAQWLNQKQLNG